MPTAIKLRMCYTYENNKKYWIGSNDVIEKMQKMFNKCLFFKSKNQSFSTDLIGLF